MSKPKKVKAKITRTVTEIAIVSLDRNGDVEEYQEMHDELDYEVDEIYSVIEVLSAH